MSGNEQDKKKEVEVGIISEWVKTVRSLVQCRNDSITSPRATAMIKIQLLSNN